MVFGNLSTGYWLATVGGAGSSDFSHWVELGRKTLTGAEDSIIVDGGAGYGFYGGDTAAIGISGGSLNFNALQDGSHDHCHIDLTGAIHSNNIVGDGSQLSNTAWVMRFKIRFSAWGSSGVENNLWVVLSQNYKDFTVNDSIDEGIGIQFENNTTSAYHANDINNDVSYASLAGTGDATQNWTPSVDTDYYVEIKRTSSTVYTVSVYTNEDYSTGNVGTLTGACTAQDLRYIKIMNRHATATERTITGTIDDLYIWNSVTTAGENSAATYTHLFDNLANKPYLMVLGSYNTSTSADPFLSFNGDGASNYAHRYSRDGGTDATDTSQSIGMRLEQGRTTPQFTVNFVNNIADQEKLAIGHTVSQNTAGAGTAPNRQEHTGKWANTSNAITQCTFDRASGDFNTGSEVVVLGYDPSGNTGTQVWEELSSVELSGTTATLDSGTFTAKKYLWCQIIAYGSGASSVGNAGLQFNSDTGSNYAERYNAQGASDVPQASQTKIRVHDDATSDDTQPMFLNFFIINTSAKEKLVISEETQSVASGAGNFPMRTETVGKWANTSAQITQIELIPGTSFASGSRIKVWGFD